MLSLCPTTSAARPLSLSLRPLLSQTHRRHSLSFSLSSPPKMSTTTETIEHIVLFKIKPNTAQAQITTMLTGLNSLQSLSSVLHITAGPIHKTQSPFTHILHSRYTSKQNLAQYSAHQAHTDVVKSSVIPICDDIMAVDWVAHNLSTPVGPPPGSAMRLQLIKLKEGVQEKEKDEVLGVIKGLKEKINCVNEISFGENFSPGRAKGFSICSIGFFNGVDELESIDGDLVIEKEKDKVRGFIDSLYVVDYVVPKSQSPSL